MKKIIMVCSCLALLLALSVPTFAADDVTNDYSGDWIFGSTVTPLDGITKFSFSFESNGIVFQRMLFSVSNGVFSLEYYNVSTSTRVVVYNSSSGWVDSIYRTIKVNSIGSAVTGFETFEPWFQLNASRVVPTCDGSSCPATDVNYDGICDDCGMSLMMSIRPYPSVDGLWEKSVYPYGVLYMRNDNIPSLYFLDNPITTTDGVDFRFNGGNFVVYNLVDGAWTYERTGQGAVEFPDLDSGRILKVSHDVNFQGAVLMYKDSDFFPTPLWETVELLTQGAMTEEMPKMGGTMTILVACGVGLMACLVVLSLFGKRSLISLR